MQAPTAGTVAEPSTPRLWGGGKGRSGMARNLGGPSSETVILKAQGLILQVQDTLMLADKPFFLVLEEDGTTVETEEYFQSLADDTVFMVLHKGQKWQPPSEQVTSHLTFSRHQQQRRGSSKRSGPLDDQPFSGLLRPENLSREELVDVLRAVVISAMNKTAMMRNCRKGADIRLETRASL